MDHLASVSKGSFAFKKKRKVSIPSPAQLSTCLWYQSYKKCLTMTDYLLKVQRERVFASTLSGLVDFITTCASAPNVSSSGIPAATLLTGVNVPDHSSLFATLSNRILDEATPHVASLWARDCSSLKATVERMCSQFMLKSASEDMLSDISEDEDSEKDSKTQKIQRWQFNLQHLLCWYTKANAESPSPLKKRKKNKSKEVGCSKLLVVIIPDFESFSIKVLQEFVLLLSGYQKQLPFVLVLGVATAMSAVHRSLPYHVSSCLKMKVFHSRPSNSYLNEVLEKVLLSADRSFHLGGKTYKLLLDVFLFHDFSVIGFIQGYQYCMMQHFYENDWSVLNCVPSELPEAVKQLTKKDIESLQKLPSLQKYIKSLASHEDIVSWLKQDEDFVKKEVVKLLSDLHRYVQAFYAALRCLHLLTSNLPGAPLEKHLRSVYYMAVSSDINKSVEFKDCIKLLSFLSSEELESKLEEILPLLQEAVKNGCTQMKMVTQKLLDLKAKFKTLWLSAPDSPSKSLRSPVRSPMKRSHSPLKSPSKSPSKLLSNISSRSQLKEKLKEMTSHDVKLSPYEQLRNEVLCTLCEELFAKFLISPQTKTLHEVLFFDDINAVKSRIIGSPRQAVLRSLKDPHFYLDCDCCKLSDINDILPTLPDVSIVYKLHLESGKLINMYDWLQSFLTIVNPLSQEEQTEVDPRLQARFTRAVAELQFLGFIKSSNRKTDHVTRITWC